MNLDELRADIRQNMSLLGQSSLRLAFQLAGVHRDRLYKKWGYKRFDAYVEAESSGNIGHSHGWRLVNIGRVFANDRDTIIAGYNEGKVSLTTLSDLSEQILRGEVSCRDVCRAIADNVPLPTPVSTGTKPTFQSVKPIPKELAAIRDMAFNVARFFLNKAQPTELDLWEWILLNAIDQAQAQTHTTSDNITIAFSAQDMVDGKIRCQECGSWDASSFDPHHVVPRSVSKEIPVIALLCRECHEIVQPKWREWALAKGYAVPAE